MWKIIPKGLILVQICLKIINDEAFFYQNFVLLKKSVTPFFLKKVYWHNKFPNIWLGNAPILII
jgi:hypothetical protein